MRHRTLHFGFILVASLATAPASEAPHPGGGEELAEQAILRASDAQETDIFGHSVAISGDLAVVGARDEDGGADDPLPEAGAAYVFRRDETDPSDWVQVARLAAADAQADDWFGYSVAIAGDTVLVGAPREDGGPEDPLGNAGAAYVFQPLEGFGWTQIRKLTASDARGGSNLGWSVAIQGDTAVVGAQDDGIGAALVGAAYVFGRDEGGPSDWGEVEKLTASDGQHDDNFGFSVGISGETVVVGAPDEDGGPGNPADAAGAAYVFELLVATGWQEVRKLIATDPVVGADLGSSVAISGDSAVVGAGSADSGAGAAYFFERDEGGTNNWGEAARFAASEGETGGLGSFGSAAISGDTAIVGARLEDGGPGDPLQDSGAAYVFRRRGDNWTEVDKVTASDAQAGDRFGYSVGISGHAAIVGAIGESGGPGDPLLAAGAAYVMRESFLELFIGDRQRLDRKRPATNVWLRHGTERLRRGTDR